MGRKFGHSQFQLPTCSSNYSIWCYHMLTAGVAPKQLHRLDKTDHWILLSPHTLDDCEGRIVMVMLWCQGAGNNVCSPASILSGLAILTTPLGYRQEMVAHLVCICTVCML